MDRISTIWTSGLDADKTPQGDKSQKEKFDEAVKSFLLGPVGNRLRRIIKDFKKDLEKQETKTDGYQSGSWSHLQAHRNGYRQALNQIDEILGIRKGNIEDE